jgi:hypothetical protein
MRLCLSPLAAAHSSTWPQRSAADVHSDCVSWHATRLSWHDTQSVGGCGPFKAGSGGCAPAPAPHAHAHDHHVITACCEVAVVVAAVSTCERASGTDSSATGRGHGLEEAPRTRQEGERLGVLGRRLRVLALLVQRVALGRSAGLLNFRDSNRQCIGKSQSKWATRREERRLQPPPHRLLECARLRDGLRRQPLRRGVPAGLDGGLPPASAGSLRAAPTRRQPDPTPCLVQRPSPQGWRCHHSPHAASVAGSDVRHAQASPPPPPPPPEDHSRARSQTDSRSPGPRSSGRRSHTRRQPPRPQLLPIPS